MKKRAIVSIFLTLSCLVFASSIDFNKVKPKFADFVNTLNQKKIESIQGSNLQEKFQDAVKKQEERNKNNKNVLSQKDVDNLFTVKNTRQKIDVKKAISDVELLFRLLKYKYDNYYEYGGDQAFDKVKSEIITELNNRKTSITSMEFERILATNFSKIIKDNHFRINDFTLNQLVPEIVLDKQYMYFYTNEIFEMDDNGYYQIIDNKKYYYESCTNSNAFIATSLSDDNLLVNRLICLCKESEITTKDSFTLSSDGVKMTKKILWTKSAYTRESHDLVEFIQTQDIAYIRCGAFVIDTYMEQMDNFLETARVAKTSKIVILDMRLNGGGDDTGERWLNAFVGEEVNTPFYEIGIKDATNSFDSVDNGKTIVSTRISKGKYYKNEPLLIVLTDIKAESAGDDVPFRTKVVENAIIIGTNTSGTVTGGASSFGRDCRKLYLPESGFFFWVGSDGGKVSYFGDEKLEDNIGCKPDIWCEPNELVQKVVKMLENYDVISHDEAKNFISKYENRKKENMAGNIEDYPDEIEVKKIESEYGTYYELRAIIDKKHPYFRAIWNFDGNSYQQYRTELTAFCNGGPQPHSQLAIYNNESPFIRTNDIYSHELVLSDSFYPNRKENIVLSSSGFVKSFDVVVRFVPTRSSYFVNIGEMPYEETRLSLEILDQNPEVLMNNSTYVNGNFIRFKDWEDNYLQRDLDYLK